MPPRTPEQYALPLEDRVLNDCPEIAQWRWRDYATPGATIEVRYWRHTQYLTPWRAYPVGDPTETAYWLSRYGVRLVQDDQADDLVANSADFVGPRQVY